MHGVEYEGEIVDRCLERMPIISCVLYRGVIYFI